MMECRRSIARNVLAGLLPAILLAGCSADDAGKKRPPPLVGATPAQSHVFVDRIEAVGTARANEQVTISASVTERVERILFDDGMFVGKGQLLAELSQGQERAVLDGALATERQALSQLDRFKELSARGFVTQTLYDQQIATVARARADAAEARAQIGDRMIRAPFSGYASLRTISAGAIVNAGVPLVTISDVSRIKLDFTVPETRLAQLRVGQPIDALAAAFPGQPFRGRISSIDPVIDPSSRAVLVRASLPNPGARLKPGMLMTVRVELGSRTSAAVPEISVLADGDEFVIAADGKAKRVPVRVGLRDAGLIEVFGLNVGQKVIGDGVVKVSEGMKVRLAGKGGAGKGGKGAGSAAPGAS